MTDSRLRELERRWKETGSPKDEELYLRECLRTGRLSEEQLALAAFCTHSVAQVILDYQAPIQPDTLREWVEGLSHWGKMCSIRAAIAAAQSCLHRWTRYPEDNRPQEALNAVIAWIHCPCAEHQESMTTAHVIIQDAYRNLELAANSQSSIIDDQISHAQDSQVAGSVLAAVIIAGDFGTSGPPSYDPAVGVAVCAAENAAQAIVRVFSEDAVDEPDLLLSLAAIPKETEMEDVEANEGDPWEMQEHLQDALEITREVAWGEIDASADDAWEAAEAADASHRQREIDDAEHKRDIRATYSYPDEQLISEGYSAATTNTIRNSICKALIPWTLDYYDPLDRI